MTCGEEARKENQIVPIFMPVFDLQSFLTSFRVMLVLVVLFLKT